MRACCPAPLTLIWRRGRVAHQSMVGAIDMARDTPMRDDAIFRLYSMTKPVTAVALLMLMEEGRIALDDPVERFIPRLRQSENPGRRRTRRAT